jgi:hypothetical protein
MQDIDYDLFVEELTECEPINTSEIKLLENKYMCYISHDYDKVGELQYIYSYDINFGNRYSGEFEIESGISRGTIIIQGEFKLNGVLHSINSPAEYSYETSMWYNKGLRHREDGPAFYDYFTGKKEWWLNDIKYSKADFIKRKRIDKINKVLE